MNGIKEAKAKIERIVKDQATELADIGEQQKKTKEIIAKANAEMQKAEASGDVDLYKINLRERNEAADVLEMYDRRRKALIGKPLVSEADYKKLAAMVKNEVSEEEEKAKARMKEVCNELQALAAHLKEIQTEANETLRRLQGDIYKNADRSKHQTTGTILYLSHEDLKVDIFRTIKWIEAPTKNINM